MKPTVEACLVCGEPLEYLERTEQMECVRCGRSFPSNARCVNGHYICDECHEKQGIEVIRRRCLETDSRNPLELAQEIMEDPFIYMHGPEHHVMVGAVLLAAYHNCGGEIDLTAALEEMIARGGQVPGGICGMWGSCGAGISTGICVSIITGATPLSAREWGLANEMTARSLRAISRFGGPRCCKRDSFTAIAEGAAFLRELTGVELEMPQRTVCGFSGRNQQCLGRRCPFNRAGQTAPVPGGRYRQSGPESLTGAPRPGDREL